MKSPPELWEELSEAERLAAHLGQFGEIRITRLEPEQKVTWESEHASGTVEIEPSGWGTRVTLTAELAEASGEAAASGGSEPEPCAQTEAAEPDAQAEVEHGAAAEPPPRRGVWARLFGRRRAEPEPLAVEAEPEPETVSDPPHPEPAAVEGDPVAAEPEPSGSGALDAERAHAVLDGALDALGAAHHRPFSRS